MFLILKEHPTYFTLRDLVIYYVEAVHNDPYRGQILTSAIAKIANSPDAPSFGRDTLHALLSRELARTLFKEFYDDDEIVKIYGPKNTFLLDSLLSGFSFKYKLTSSPEMHFFLNKGFKTPHSSNDSELELSVVGSSVQLLLSGSRIKCECYHGWERDVAKKLKAHEVAGTVKDLHAIEVLKVDFSYLLFWKKWTNLCSSQSGMPKPVSCRKTNAMTSGLSFSQRSCQLE